jgi:alanine dehydrogenase
MLLSIASDGGVESAVRSANMIRSGVYMFKGTLTHSGIAEERGLPYKDLDLLLATY